jgi:hypothetical protein
MQRILLMCPLFLPVSHLFCCIALNFNKIDTLRTSMSSLDINPTPSTPIRNRLLPFPHKTFRFGYFSLIDDVSRTMTTTRISLPTSSAATSVV